MMHQHVNVEFPPIKLSRKGSESSANGRPPNVSGLSSGKIVLKRKPSPDKLPRLSKSAKVSRRPAQTSYKYLIRPGNNCRLIMQALRKRPWWHPVSTVELEGVKKLTTDTGNSISLLWEMYKNPNKFKSAKYKNTLYNHLEFNNALVTKKGLYESLKNYCQGPRNSLNIDILTIIPRTFYLCPSGMANSKGAELARDDMQEWLDFNRTFTRQQRTTAATVASASVKATSISSSNSDRGSNGSNSDTTVGVIVDTAACDAVVGDSNNNIGDDADRMDISPSKEAASRSGGAGNVSDSSMDDMDVSMTVPVAVTAPAEPAVVVVSTLSTPPPPLAVAAASDGSVNDDAVWILKPASLTNRGFGIQVVRGVNAVLKVVDSIGYDDTEEADRPDSAESSPTKKSTGTRPPPTENGLEKAANTRGARTGWIVQEYMERPLLISGRKFDIRCYVVLTLSTKVGLKAYFYNDAYIRTSCKKYNLSQLEDRETHLTNDAVQKHSKNYGKFEQGNKLSLTEWQSSINVDYPGVSPSIVMDQIFPRIKELTRYSILAAQETLCKSTFSKSFELLGYEYV